MKPTGGIDTLVGTGMQVSGDVTCNGTMCVQGCIEGNVKCDGHPGATLIVDGSGTVKGNVCVSHLVVRGKVEGSIDAANSMELHDTARVTGDVCFRALSIHPGAVIEGQMTPKPPASGEPATGSAAPSAALPGLPSAKIASKLSARHALAAGIVVLAVAGIYFGRGNTEKPPTPDEPVRAEKQAPAPGKSSERPSAPPPVQTAAQSAPPMPPPAEKPAAPVEATPPAAAESEAPPALVVETNLGETKFITVRGANPARPANVFLLVSDEPTVLYRKKRGESGDGTRVPVSEGKVTVTVAPDDLIRVAKGSDVTIYFQGQKVSAAQLQEHWVSFVRR